MVYFVVTQALHEFCSVKLVTRNSLQMHNCLGLLEIVSLVSILTQEVGRSFVVDNQQPLLAHFVQFVFIKSFQIGNFVFTFHSETVCSLLNHQNRFGSQKYYQISF